MRFSETYQTTADLCEKNRPFYAAPIWTELKKLLDIAYKEAVSYKVRSENGRDWLKYWDEADAARNSILEQIEVVSNSIRSRLEEFKNSQ